MNKSVYQPLFIIMGRSQSIQKPVKNRLSFVMQILDRFSGCRGSEYLKC